MMMKRAITKRVMKKKVATKKVIVKKVVIKKVQKGLLKRYFSCIIMGIDFYSTHSYYCSVPPKDDKSVDNSKGNV